MGEDNIACNDCSAIISKEWVEFSISDGATIDDIVCEECCKKTGEDFFKSLNEKSGHLITEHLKHISDHPKLPFSIIKKIIKANKKDS